MLINGEKVEFVVSGGSKRLADRVAFVFFFVVVVVVVVVAMIYDFR